MLDDAAPAPTGAAAVDVDIRVETVAAASTSTIPVLRATELDPGIYLLIAPVR